MLRAVLALLLLGAPGLAAAQDLALPPRDEAAADPSFVTFRAHLLGALAARDTAAVLAAVAPDATLNLGGDPVPDARAAFREQWLGTDGTWGLVAETIALGSAMDDPAFVTTPYYFGAWPDSLDAFSHVAILGEKVNVRRFPEADAEVLGTLSYAIAPVELGGGTRDYVRVLHGPDRTPAFVAARYVGSPIGYRAGFEKREGRWLLTFFVSGD